MILNVLKVNKGNEFNLVKDVVTLVVIFLSMNKSIEKIKKVLRQNVIYKLRSSKGKTKLKFLMKMNGFL